MQMEWHEAQEIVRPLCPLERLAAIRTLLTLAQPVEMGIMAGHARQWEINRTVTSLLFLHSLFLK
jgi:hypothetical protein